MQIGEIHITYARTIPTKSYGNDRVEVTAISYIDEHDDFEAIATRLRQQLRAQVEAAEAELLNPPVPENLFERLKAGQGSTQQ